MKQKHLTLIAATGLAVTIILSAAGSALAAGTSQTAAIEQTGNPPGGQPGSGQPNAPQGNQGQTPQNGQPVQPCVPSGNGAALQPGQQPCAPQQPDVTPQPTDVPVQPPQPSAGNPNGSANPANPVPLSELLGIDCSDIELKSPLKTLNDGTQKFDWSEADGLTSYRVNLYRVDGPPELVGVYATSDDDTDLKADLSDLKGDKFEWEVQGLYNGQVVCTTEREGVEMED